MSNNDPQLDALQNAYRSGVENWVATIRAEEALASLNDSLADIDRWEQAHFDEESARTSAKAAKRNYEAALREKFFKF